MVITFKEFVYKYKQTLQEGKDPERKEKGYMAAFNKQIERVKRETGKDHVVIHHNGETYHITHAEKTKGNPKSDFTLKGKDGRHIYISHKDYTGSGDLSRSYQQLGGVSRYSDHPSVQRFANAVNREHGGTAVGKGTIAKKLKMKTKQDRTLVKKAMFGKDHEEGGERGPHAVHSIMHGTMVLTPHPKRKGAFHITASHVIHHTDEPEGGYMIYGRTAKSGSSKRNDLGLKHTRVSIASDKSRSVSHWVKE